MERGQRHSGDVAGKVHDQKEGSGASLHLLLPTVKVLPEPVWP